MKKGLLLSVLLTLLFTSIVGQSSPELQNILQNVNPGAIKGHMTFLSDDLLEGRLPGTNGFALASKYMETQFAALGLQPGVGDSSYIQQVPLQKAWVEENECSFSIHDQNSQEVKLEYGKQFLTLPYFAGILSNISAPLVFVGFGVSAPEFKYDDYNNMDVKDKIVVFINDAPKGLPADARAYYTSRAVKYSEALKRGAVGAISFFLPTSRFANWEVLGRSSKRPSYRWVNNQSVAVNSYAGLKATVNFNIQYVDQLFVHAPTGAQKIFELASEGKSQSFPLNLSATIQVKTATKIVESSNVVGMLKGTDPTLRNEYVVYSAHLDHLGIGALIQNDSIYNGAHDNASGNAILLEIAKAYSSLAVLPKRSIIFTTVTGEESGLLGSDYLVNNFPVKNGNIIANLNIDGPFFFHPLLDIVPYGADNSSLGQQVRRAAQMLKLKISPDPFPEQVAFIRSDHYSFIKKGIPSLFIISGFMTIPQDTVNRAKSDVAWFSTIYHTPQDNMNQPFDFNAAAMHVKANFLTGYFVSNEPSAPTWNKGDFFGQKFKRKAD